MKLAVTGNAILAETTRACCAKNDAGSTHRLLLAPVDDRDIEVLWVCHDTPILDDGTADVETVVNWMQRDIAELAGAPVILISSQLPVLTTFRMQERFPRHFFAYSPENIRVASAAEDFCRQSRIVVGVPNGSRNSTLEALLGAFTSRIIFTRPETAEMVKHALNAYLGMSIAFINEIARVCADVKADVNVVSEALLSERRIAPNAPLRPGKPFGGGHLMRDILTLERIAKGRGLSLPIVTHIRESNNG
jgi:UDPglucose 6-dehydrogenase